MKKIINPKYILYMLLPTASIIMGMLLLFDGDVINYTVSGVVGAAGSGLAFCIFMFIPHSYVIDKGGISTFYRIKGCNYIPWSDITGINTSFDAFYENLFFWKDYVISHKNMKRNGRAINTVTKTKKTKELIAKYWWRGVDSISLLGEQK